MLVRQRSQIARSSLLALRARQMRSAPTPSEAALWALIGRRQLGVVFRRQVVLAGRFIVDFCAPSVGLVVEVDGGCHSLRRGADARRDEKLRRLGFRVLRIKADVVLKEPSVTLHRLRTVLP